MTPDVINDKGHQEQNERPREDGDHNEEALEAQRRRGRHGNQSGCASRGVDLHDVTLSCVRNST
jgi:hypothetical protein